MWVMEKMEVRMNALARSSPEPVHVFRISRYFDVRYIDIRYLDRNLSGHGLQPRAGHGVVDWQVLLRYVRCYI